MEVSTVPEAEQNGHVPDEAQEKLPIDEVETAKGEVVEEAKMIDWHGMAVTLPPNLPASFWFGTIKAQATGGEGDDIATQTVYKLVGAEQWEKITAYSEEIGLVVTFESIGEFINSIFAQYGMGGGAGESPESSTSSAGDGDS